MAEHEIGRDIGIKTCLNRNLLLTVDDDPLNLFALGKILFDEYDIIVAKSGKEAIDVAIARVPDLILLDVVLPDISGFDVIKRLKEEPETKKIPIIFITGLSTEADEEKGLLLGARDYISKPFLSAIVKARVGTQIEIVNYTREIERLSYYDPLTGLPNRRKFNDRIALEWKRAARERQSMAFMMLDIDKFKGYNDAYGHPQGDELLKAVGEVLSGVVKRSSDLPARLGGEEFGVLLPNTEIDAAVRIAETIRLEIKDMVVPLLTTGKPTSTTISIGVAAEIPPPGSDYDWFLKLADDRLYAAKDTGRDKIVFEDTKKNDL